jgi:hypothetical protein
MGRSTLFGDTIEHSTLGQKILAIFFIDIKAH